MNITVFQALTILADTYRRHPEQKATFDAIKYLYLSGVRCDKDEKMLHELLTDTALEGYRIVSDKEHINADPVRRYFESHLAYQTLVYSLEPLSEDILLKHLDYVLQEIDKPLMAKIDDTLFSLDKKRLKEQTGLSREIGDIIYTYSFNSSWKSRLGERAATDALFLNRKKIRYLAASVIGVHYAGYCKPYPLNLYDKEGSVYKAPHRGRTPRTDKTTGEMQNVHSNNLGIMRSYMPLSQTDALFCEEASDYLRPADASTYIEDGLHHLIPDRIFATLVTPFVNSISGTLLMQIRVIAQLIKENKFIYSHSVDEEQLKLFFKNLIACMVFTIGGHSLEEYTSVFALPEIEMELRTLPGFSALNLEHLFKIENELAFKEAMDKTIEYNAAILRRMALHDALRSNPAAKLHPVLNTTTNGDDAPIKTKKPATELGATSTEHSSAAGAGLDVTAASAPSSFSLFKPAVMPKTPELTFQTAEEGTALEAARMLKRCFADTQKRI